MDETAPFGQRLGDLCSTQDAVINIANEGVQLDSGDTDITMPSARDGAVHSALGNSGENNENDN